MIFEKSFRYHIVFFFFCRILYI